MTGNRTSSCGHYLVTMPTFMLVPYCQCLDLEPFRCTSKRIICGVVKRTLYVQKGCQQDLFLADWSLRPASQLVYGELARFSRLVCKLFFFQASIELSICTLCMFQILDVHFTYVLFCPEFSAICRRNTLFKMVIHFSRLVFIFSFFFDYFYFYIGLSTIVLLFSYNASSLTNLLWI